MCPRISIRGSVCPSVTPFHKTQKSDYMNADDHPKRYHDHCHHRRHHYHQGHIVGLLALLVR